MLRHRIAAYGAICGAAAGIVSFAVLHVILADAVDPLRHPVSAYGLRWPGNLLFGCGALGFGIACAALAALPRHLFPRTLLTAAAVAFGLVVLFPTDAGDGPVVSTSGQIHRYAAGAAFVLLAVWSGGQRRAGRGLPLLTLANWVTLLITTLNTFLPELAAGGDWRGLPQRVLLLVHAATMIAVARAFLRRYDAMVTVSATRVRCAHRAATGTALPASANATPSTIQPGSPQPITTVVNTAGATTSATWKPVLYRPWYWPRACSGASSKEMPQPPAACSSSPATNRFTRLRDQ